eukprot:4716175-Ditylum_brightwellii.AAC.1
MTSEANEHTFSRWRQQQQEFNLLQIMGIEEKQRVRMVAIYESGLATCRSKSRMKGYQVSFSEFVESSMDRSSKSKNSGGVDIDLDKPAVTQLWNEVDGLLKQ